MSKPVIRKYGSNGILMEWEPLISPEINERVVRTAAFIGDHYVDAVLEIVPSYQSLLDRLFGML